MNLHCKDKFGKHRIIEGSISFLADQNGLRKTLNSLGIQVEKGSPILGFIRGGKYNPPHAFAIILLPRR